MVVTITSAYHMSVREAWYKTTMMLIKHSGTSIALKTWMANSKSMGLLRGGRRIKTGRP